MLVSTQHRFVFLANHKCASSSIAAALGPYCNLFAERDYRLRHANFAHYQQFILPFLEAMVGAEVREYKVYCLFREPVDWLFSWYRFRMREELVSEQMKYTGNIDWRVFMEEAFKERAAPYANLPAQHRFVKGLDGTADGLTIFRYDEIDLFVDALTRQIGEPLKIYNWNVSPVLDFRPSEKDRKRCRDELVEDYAVYDVVGRRENTHL